MIWVAFTCLAFFNFLCLPYHPSAASPQQMSILLKSSKTDVFQEGYILTTILLAQRWLTSLGMYTVAHYASFPCKSRKGHSFCINTVLTAAAAGLPDWLIKFPGRWS